jgi:antitoxin VapB
MPKQLKQLNIRSDKAHGLATALAKRMNLSTTKVVEKALLELYRKTPPGPPHDLTPEQKTDHDAFMALVREFQKYKLPGATSAHSDMYDENGLPI